jgi:hypothetical protein
MPPTLASPPAGGSSSFSPPARALLIKGSGLSASPGFPGNVIAAGQRRCPDLLQNGVDLARGQGSWVRVLVQPDDDDRPCVRCPVLRIDPDQRPRLADLRDNLTARIAEAEREGWLGEAEGLRVSLAAARDKLAQLDERTRRAATVSLGIPAYRDIAARTATVPGNLP